jgi:hypothetical protein
MIRYISGLAALVAAALVVLSTVATGSLSAATPDPQLLRTYQPVIHLDPAEHFAPTSVQTFISDSTLEQLSGGNWVVTNSDPGPGNLPGPGTGTWRLNQQPCTPSSTLGGLDCNTTSWSQDPGSSVVYGRVAHEDGETILQYWFFYYDDVYSYFYPPSDVLWQAHEGDWEVVNVVLDEDGQPDFVGYSQHCLGQQRTWASTTKWNATHPIVYVATGSHANYFDSGTHPINLTCVPAQVQFVLFFVLHLTPPVDYTGNGTVAGPPRSGNTLTHIEQIDSAAHSWIAFPGYWGEGEYFYAALVTPTPALAGPSPTGPAYHAIWTDPLATLATWPAG